MNTYDAQFCLVKTYTYWTNNGKEKSSIRTFGPLRRTAAEALVHSLALMQVGYQEIKIERVSANTI